MRPELLPDDLCQTERLRIEALRDAVMETHGHHPGGSYARQFWLPLLGPSAFVGGIALVEGLQASPEGYELEIDSWGLTLGLSGRLQRQRKPARVLGRLARYGLAYFHADPTALYRVRLAWPPLTRRQLDRLPAFLVELHEAA